LKSITGDLEDGRRIRVAVGVTEEEIRRLAQADEIVAQQLNGRQIVKVIVAPQKLINIVVK
jgi:leucyl-tRNA synthetase